MENVIDFLVRSGALKFGEFTLKSGRKAPYFINTGSFDSGEKITALGSLYAAHMIKHGLERTDTVFGPAYKGVSLCVATASALFREHGKNIGFTYNRKEAKTRGEGGTLVGTPLTSGSSAVIVEDVVTAGTTLNEVVPLIKDLGARIDGVDILVDRCERGSGELSAVAQAEHELGVKVYPLTTVYEIVEYLSAPNASGLVLNEMQRGQVREYLAEYGGKRA